MVGALSRRGPDGNHVVAFDHVTLGHARLAIIDLDTGDQPQGNADDSVVVVVNGEIYNYVELRRRLEAEGHRFRTQSDIEVIPHLYDEHGLAFVEHLRGMFAIALYDRREQSLVLVRDRLGKKPLYYAEVGDRFYFASELKALLQIGSIELSIDPEAVDDYFTYQYIPAPRTAFREIKKLPAAHLLERRPGRSSLHEYWTLPAPVEGDVSEEEALERIRAELDEAVRIRLRADVPVGAFLSGGIDSTLVVATAAKMASEPLRTTTIDFGGAASAEVPVAARVAARFGTRHTVHPIVTGIRDVFDKVSSYLDEPLGDSSVLPSWLVSRGAREDVKVAISGDGGDETFGGYAWRYYQNLMLDRFRQRLPGAAGRSLVGLASRLYPKLDRMPKPLRLKWGLRNLSVTAEEAYFLDMSIFRPEDKVRLYRREFQRRLQGYRAGAVLESHFARVESQDLLSRLLYVDLKTYLADGVLAKVDRMSMANSLEVRSPLLDHKIVELAASLPSELKMRGKTSKYLLRQLARERVGADVADGPKTGFAPPLAQWLRHELGEVFRDYVLESSQGIHFFLDPAAVRRLYEEHASGRRNHARPLWLILGFELWFRNFGVRARV